MSNKLDGKKVAVLVADGFEQVELLKPVEALRNEGAEVKVVSPKDKKVKGWNFDHWDKEIDVDIPLDQADPNNFDAILLPGGQMNPDILRANDKAVQFVKHFCESGKPIAAICHGPWTLIETGFVKGKKMTSYKSIKTDLKNAGADWVDQEVVTDQGLVTSRNPDDIPAFNRKMIEEIAEGTHERRRAA
jgi:protease I